MWIVDLLYKVEDIMDRDYLRVDKGDNLKKVLDLMLQNGREEVLVFDDDKLIGIFTIRDVPKSEELSLKVVKDYMKTNIITVPLGCNIREARDLMIKNNIGRLPVVEDGKVVGILTTNDIRDKFYLKIDEFYKFQREILDNIHEAVCIIDKNGIVIYWNKSAEKLYEIPSDKILGKPILDFFPNALILKALKGEKIENVYHKPRYNKTVILSVIPIFDDNGQIIAAVSTDRDVTEIMTLSEQLERTKKKLEIIKHQYKRQISQNYSFSSIVGKSKKIIEAISIAQRVASSSASILITGESGTGKEVFAKAIHDASGREGNFVAINCSAIPETLLESELFGYVEGAFTGALKKGKIGKFEIANNGTLFLDEIGDMPLSMQVKLLRVLQDGVIYKLGDEKPTKVNVRIIAATNKNLEKMIKEGTFREDLYYRLAVVQINLPPLRERKEDIKELSYLFFNMFAEEEGIEIKRIDKKVLEVFENYKWEGNVRELKNVIQRMIILSNNGEITLDLVPEYILNYNKNSIDLNIQNAQEYDLQRIIENVEKNVIKKVLDITNGNKNKAAKMLNIKRSTLYYKLNQYGLK
ncbi:PAS domain S-box-containing protein [Caloramator fervidus]|uniref:PAS domain S-box-containing protein n=1 Tax=Caloramator fervidus TaxID=29344 RepID=A0A1H5X3H4_9CLOT|nr:sigma-54 dependent transcriptional regulator PrdR [Caloramator fervidus]SEG05907.1 PAS domain S-box-containing protein [Caloramator fervidus]